MLTLTESCIILCLEWRSKDDKTTVSINVNGWSVQIKSIQDWEPSSRTGVDSSISCSR